MFFAISSLLLVFNAASVLAHGTVIRISSGGKDNTPWLVYKDIYKNPVPERFTRRYASNGYISDVNSIDLRCNKNDGGVTNQPAPLQNLMIRGGDNVEFGWDTWPESHKGPVMTYLAHCPNENCTNWDGSGDVWFKVQGDGLLNADQGTWAASTIATDGFKSSFKMPSDLAPGAYIMRHEALALHSAQDAGGAQFYPSCHQITLASSGSLEPKGYAIPGIYNPNDAGILINIYYPKVMSYQIPGPPLYSNDTSNSVKHQNPQVSSSSSSSSSSSQASPLIYQASSTVSSIATSSPAAYQPKLDSSLTTPISADAKAAVANSVSTSNSIATPSFPLSTSDGQDDYDDEDEYCDPESTSESASDYYTVSAPTAEVASDSSTAILANVSSISATEPTLPVSLTSSVQTAVTNLVTQMLASSSLPLSILSTSSNTAAQYQPMVSGATSAMVSVVSISTIFVAVLSLL